MWIIEKHCIHPLWVSVNTNLYGLLFKDLDVGFISNYNLLEFIKDFEDDKVFDFISNHSVFEPLQLDVRGFREWEYLLWNRYMDIYTKQSLYLAMKLDRYNRMDVKNIHNLIRSFMSK